VHGRIQWEIPDDKERCCQSMLFDVLSVCGLCVLPRSDMDTIDVSQPQPGSSSSAREHVGMSKAKVRALREPAQQPTAINSPESCA